MLHYGDVEEDTDNPPIEMLQEKSESTLAAGAAGRTRVLKLSSVCVLSPSG